jgi:hypothetical protein
LPEVEGGECFGKAMGVEASRETDPQIILHPEAGCHILR